MTIGGDLLSIHSIEDVEVQLDRHETVWIGLSAPDPTTGYVWSDGSPLHFQHWEEGEPNNKNNVESCAEFEMYKSKRSGSWNDVHCETYHGWLCQIRAGVTPNPPPDRVAPDYNKTSDGWIEWNGDQYYIQRNLMAMEDARQFCQQRHGDLVIINSEAENMFLWKQTSRYSGFFWIGLNVDLDRTFTWMDGSPVVFQRWDENQPDFHNNDENCAIMTSAMGFWRDCSCGYEYNFICKRSGSPPANATVAPTLPPRGSCPQNWKQLNSKCFNIINNQRETWEGARTQCRAMGGNLASILSRHEQVFLSIEMTKAPKTNLWIGLYNKHGEQFHWTDGRPMRYSNWGTQVRRNEIHRPWESYHYIPFHDEIYFADLFSQDSKMNECAGMTTDTKIGSGKWITMSCNDTNGYVCLRNLDPSLPDSPKPTVTIEYVKVFNDSIKVVTQPMNWYAAQSHCQRDDANLASLRNEWSQLYVELMALNLNSAVWIGLNKMQTDRYFRYVAGWHLTLSNWDRREPSNDRDCVYVDVDGKWKTANCNQNMTSICMKTTDVPPTESSDFPGFCPEDPEPTRYGLHRSTWQTFKSHCYLFITDKIEWPDASASCVKHGGTLASIEDPTEQEFIQSNLKIYKDSHSTFWIGLYKTHRGLWKWLDKTVIDYTNWDIYQSTDNGYGSIEVTNGKWRTGKEWHDRGYICKALKVLQHKPPTTTASPNVDLQTRGHGILTAVLVITVIVIVIFIALTFFKKSGLRLLIPENLTNFENPLFSNNEQSQPDLVDTKKLVANAEEESPEPILIL